MDLIKYHFSEPDEILSLDSQTFELLIHQKIYRVNLKFANSQKCMDRLVEFLKVMEASPKNLKIVKDLIRRFQSSILFFLKDFYEKSDVTFSEALIKNESDTELVLKKKGKYETHLLYISSMYKSLTDEVGKIEELEFLTKYGTSEKRVDLVKSDTEIKYLRFLKKCFQEQVKMKDPNIRPECKFDRLIELENELVSIMKECQSCYLEKLTFKRINEKLHSIIDVTKHASNSLLKSVVLLQKMINVDRVNKDKRQTDKVNNFRIDPDCLEVVKNILPCCRTFFYQNQPIHHAQSFTLEYKNYLSPYDRFCTTNLKKAICGFLNREGGIILVGILEREDKSKQVRGQFYSQNQKEEAMKEYRSICTQIYPDIIAQTKYKIKFVPIKSGNRKYIPGKYIVRVQVAHGNQKNLYTYKENVNQYAAFRTANQVLKRQINQETLLKFKQKLLNPMKINPIHDNPCPDPQMGQQIWKNRSAFNKNKNNKRYQNQKDSDQNSSENSKKDKKQSWTQKMEHTAFQKKEKKPLDFVYFSEKKTQAQPEEEPRKNHKFICDNDEQDDSRRKKSRQQEVQPVIQNEQNVAKNDESIDFKSLNPVVPRIKPETRVRIPYQYVSRQERQKSKIQEPNQIKQVPYKLEGVSKINQVNQKPISETISLDLLIVGFPYQMVTQQIKNHNLKLVEEPIKCNNDHITWLKISSLNTSISDNYDRFNKAVMRKHQEMKMDKKLRVRKVFSNLIFQDQILLNKLIHRYRHDQEFTDRDGCIYYSFKNNMEAIQAYVIGWEMNIKLKFISDSELKKNKLQYLRFKAETLV